MKKRNVITISADVLRIILIVLGSIFSTAVLAFSVLALTSIQANDLPKANRFLLIIFVVLGLSRLVTFLQERTKISFMRFVTLFIFDVALGIIVLFAKDKLYLYSLCGGLYCLSIIISRLFKMLENKSLRSYIYNGIIIALSILLAIGLLVPNEYAKETDIILIVCFVVAISAFLEVISNASTYLRAKVLFKIILRTFALEVILGLITMIVGCSLLFVVYEDGITNFADGLWYSFAVVTTIGFGDFTATTAIGRILTFLLGIYGIVVVAVITSIIVNFYNETAGKHDSKELKEIKEEEKKK